MQKKGKFILFTVTEFDQWLQNTNFNRVINIIQNHHTYIPNYKHFKQNNHFSMLEGMENSHIQRGFAEIAQNLTIFPDGVVAVCRSFEKIPAGIVGANQTGICIENIGNFDAGGDQMNPIQRDTIVQVNALLCREFKLAVNENTVVYHHWYDLKTGKRTNGTGTTKTCPGTNFFGGNTVQAAQVNFYPLVQAALNKGTVKPAGPKVIKTGQTTNNLNVRVAPDVNSTKVKQLQKGIKVDVFEEKKGWYRIHPTEQHWVSGAYVQP